MLPTFAQPKKASEGQRNLLFFGHFGDMSESEYMDAMETILSSDTRLYETAVRDIYSLGRYLYRKKYRFLRYAYVALLTGFVLATIVEIWVLI
ncbi:MAG TPA: Pycsar system effector family protein [Thermoanaerobaculia bacterium]|nr:Pycsar system effector family protein [Thermoanaerobaculia bacterium]